MGAKGSAAVVLSGSPAAFGSLQLAVTNTTTPVTFDLVAQNVSIASNGSGGQQSAGFSAGFDFPAQGGAANGGVINLTNAGNGFQVAGGQVLSLSANNSYTLNVPGPVTNSGTLAGGATPGASVNITSLTNATGGLVAPAGGDLNIQNPQSAGWFEPSAPAA